MYIYTYIYKFLLEYMFANESLNECGPRLTIGFERMHFWMRDEWKALFCFCRITRCSTLAAPKLVLIFGFSCVCFYIHTYVHMCDAYICTLLYYTFVDSRVFACDFSVQFIFHAIYCWEREVYLLTLCVCVCVRFGEMLWKNAGTLKKIK